MFYDLYNIHTAIMPKGGLRTDKQGTTNHLFTPKWELGKTTAIRIPEVLKDKLLALARYLDKKSKQEIEKINVVEELENNNALNQQAFKLHNHAVVLNNKIEMLTHINEELTKQLKAISKLNRYQIASECFKEFIESQQLNMEELSKSRKGTKKHQLAEINQWLIEQSEDI